MISILVTLFWIMLDNFIIIPFFKSFLFRLVVNQGQRPLVQSLQESWLSTRTSLPSHFDCHWVSQKYKIMFQLPRKSPACSLVGPSQVCILQFCPVSPNSICKGQGQGWNGPISLPDLKYWPGGEAIDKHMFTPSFTFFGNSLHDV